MQSLLITIAHFVSQVSGRWVPLPEFSDSGADTTAASVITERHLLDRINEIKVLYPREAAWLDRYLASEQGGLCRLYNAMMKHFEAVERSGARYLLANSPAYPFLLRQIRGAPHAITVLGNPSILSSNAVSVVGARKASAGSLSAAFETGRLLAEGGIPVVSGGAYGCDIAAHRGTLAAGRKPVPAAVVFAGGVDSTYPGCHRALFGQILDNGGALVSERLMGVVPKPRDFAVRNRIIAGLSRITVLIQAMLKSGALITVRHALDMGRDVLVLDPGRPDVRFEGNFRLMEEGALSFVSCRDPDGPLVREVLCHHPVTY